MLKTVSAMLVATAAVVSSAFAAFAQSPSWSEVFSGQGRFAVLQQFNGEAVLDRETGLVWQQAPLAEPIGLFPVASRHCINLSAGTRRGWRLPSIQELESLTDAAESNPSLTAGHPFVNLDLESHYWSSTAAIDDPDSVWSMRIADARIVRAPRCVGGGCGEPKIRLAVWCVRGGSGPEAQ